jgi:hypothetical protein
MAKPKSSGERRARRRRVARQAAKLTAQRRGAFQSPPEGKVYDRPAGTRPGPQPAAADYRDGSSVVDRMFQVGQIVSPRSGPAVLPATSPPTRRIQSHVGPPASASQITRRRRI